MNHIKTVKTTKPFRDPKTKPKILFTNWLPLDTKLILSIKVKSLATNRLAINKKVNASRLGSQLSIANISLSLIDKSEAQDIEIAIAKVRPISCPTSSINPLLKPL